MLLPLKCSSILVYLYIVYSIYTVAPIPILQMKELRKNSKKKSTYYIQLDISEHPKLAYKTAQNIALFAPNLEEYLERLATLQEYNLDEWIKWPKIKQKKGTKYPFPTPICVRDALRSYCDLTGPLVYNIYIYIYIYWVGTHLDIVSSN